MNFLYSQSPLYSKNSSIQYAEPISTPTSTRIPLFSQLQVVHPKSDVQRKSLLEAVKNILLFRSLEPHQLGEVLDAMFYREVVDGEYIIHAGDDGDNFYVIERWVRVDGWGGGRWKEEEEEDG